MFRKTWYAIKYCKNEVSILLQNRLKYAHTSACKQSAQYLFLTCIPLTLISFAGTVWFQAHFKFSVYIGNFRYVLAAINPSHKSHDAPTKYSTIQHLVKEVCKRVHISVENVVVWYGTGAFWALQVSSIWHDNTTTTQSVWYLIAVKLSFPNFTLPCEKGHPILSHHTTSYHVMSYPITFRLYHIASYHVASLRIVSHRILSRHITSQPISSHHISHHSMCHVTPYSITSNQIISRDITFCHITLCWIISYNLTFYHIIFYHITYYYIIYHHIISHHIRSYITSHHMPYHITSDHITSYPIKSFCKNMTVTTYHTYTEQIICK